MSEVRVPHHNLPRTLLQLSGQVMAASGGIGSVEVLATLGAVRDQSDKWIVKSRGGAPALVVMLAPAAFPDVVQAATARAAAVRAGLPSWSAAAVLVPLCSGYCDGRSFAITRYRRPVGGRDWPARWRRWQVRPQVFRWLREITHQTQAAAADNEVAANWELPLHRLATGEHVSSGVRACAREALTLLLCGQWRPLHVLAHNDLWQGNVLLGAPGQPGPGFSVIDWGAAQVRGYPAYDLVRAAMSFRLTSLQLAHELSRHAEILCCAPSMMQYHLCAALAHLGEHRGEWPARCFAAAAHSAIDCLEQGSRFLLR